MKQGFIPMGAITFRPYAAGDVFAIAIAKEGAVPATVEALAQSSWSFTALDGAAIVGCGGIARVATWRGLAWSVLAQGMPPRAMVAVRQRIAAQFVLAEADGMTAIETEVALHFDGGHPWVKSLGFRFAGLVPGAAGVARYVWGERAWAGVPASVQALLELTERTLFERTLSGRALKKDAA